MRPCFSFFFIYILFFLNRGANGVQLVNALSLVLTPFLCSFCFVFNCVLFSFNRAGLVSRLRLLSSMKLALCFFFFFEPTLRSIRNLERDRFCVRPDRLEISKCRKPRLSLFVHRRRCPLRYLFFFVIIPSHSLSIYPFLRLGRTGASVHSTREGDQPDELVPLKSLCTVESSAIL